MVKTLVDLVDETLSANVFLPIILTTKNMEQIEDVL